MDDVTFVFGLKQWMMLALCFVAAYRVKFFLQVGPSTFEAKLQPHLLWTLEQVGTFLCDVSLSLSS